MKKVVALFLAIVLLIGCIPAAFAASPEAVEAANALYALGLFKGVGKNADGTPNFALDRAPTRHEAVTMLVRLLGKEDEAKAGEWDIPFTDVADWAVPYVGYAYENALTKGVSATKFGGNSTVTASQYITFVLRALGYDSSTDFKWDKAWELSDQLGITNGEYNAETESFTRGDVAIISAAALRICAKGSDETLLSTLVSNGAVTEDAANAFLNAPVSVQSVKLSEEIIYLEIDETKTLTAEIQPEDAADTSLTWSSSDKTVATVKDGKVTGVGSGSAVITATASNGVSATCRVEVAKESIFDFLARYIKENGTADSDGYSCRFSGTYDIEYNFSLKYYEDQGLIKVKGRIDATDTNPRISTSMDVTKELKSPYTFHVEDSNVFKGTMSIYPMYFTEGREVKFKESSGSIGNYDKYAVTILTTELTCLEDSILAPNGYSIKELGFENLYKPLESLTLKENSITVFVGETASLTPDFDPESCSNRGLRWSSSNKKVATVDKFTGEITAVGEGTCEITATASNGAAAKCKVEVKPAEVRSIKLSNTSLTLNVGSSETIKATIEPSSASDTALTWSTSNKSVATVKDGKITAVGEGKCEITVTAPNGVEAKCKVEVEKVKLSYYIANNIFHNKSGSQKFTLTDTKSGLKYYVDLIFLIYDEKESILLDGLEQKIIFTLYYWDNNSNYYSVELRTKNYGGPFWMFSEHFYYQEHNGFKGDGEIYCRDGLLYTSKSSITLKNYNANNDLSAVYANVAKKNLDLFLNFLDSSILPLWGYNLKDLGFEKYYEELHS